MDLVIRPATPEDSAAIRALVVALAEYERLDPPDSAAQERLLADAFRPQPRVEIAVAVVDGAVVGYAFFFETYSTFLARPTLYLEDLFVLPPHRGAGVGKALFAHLAREAARRGCGRMEWAVLEWNEPALAFYRRLGARHLADWQTFRLDRAALERYEV
jgi:GNAT superfamily N-acetyltransferase